MRIVITLAFFGLLLFAVSPLFSGYTLTTDGAIKSLNYPKDMKEVFEGTKSNREFHVWETKDRYYIAMLQTKWFFYKKTATQPLSLNKKEIKTIMPFLNAVQEAAQYRDLSIIAFVPNKKITKLIVTNEPTPSRKQSVKEAKEKSTIYLEIPVKQNFAIYADHNTHKPSARYVYRGLNKDGTIIDMALSQ